MLELDDSVQMKLVNRISVLLQGSYDSFIIFITYKDKFLFLRSLLIPCHWIYVQSPVLRLCPIIFVRRLALSMFEMLISGQYSDVLYPLKYIFKCCSSKILHWYLFLRTRPFPYLISLRSFCHTPICIPIRRTHMHFNYKWYKWLEYILKKLNRVSYRSTSRTHDALQPRLALSTVPTQCLAIAKHNVPRKKRIWTVQNVVFLPKIHSSPLGPSLNHPHKSWNTCWTNGNSQSWTGMQIFKRGVNMLHEDLGIKAWYFYCCFHICGAGQFWAIKIGAFQTLFECVSRRPDAVSLGREYQEQSVFD